MKKLIAGNWKMNGLGADARALTADIVNGVQNDKGIIEAVDLLVCPPALYIADVKNTLGTGDEIKLGAQNVSPQGQGAYTGDICAEMLKDSGCAYVIIGHSERREYHGETDSDVEAKARAALKHGVTPIICVGETLEQREAGQAEEIVGAQILESVPDDLSADDVIVIAYEPVWAIGTGKTASAQDAQDMHAHIREVLAQRVSEPKDVRILYGGSMKPENAAELLAQSDIDGGLIGGASLRAESFLAIARAV